MDIGIYRVTAEKCSKIVFILLYVRERGREREEERGREGEKERKRENGNQYS